MSETEFLYATEANIARAVAVLREGGLVAFPTDTVYGLAAWPWDERAVRRLYAAKRRPANRPIPLLLSDVEVLGRVARLPERARPLCRRLFRRFWPGGLTLVLPKSAQVPESVSPGPTVAVRVPDLSLARRLIREAGGVLAVTSANRSGQLSTITAQEVREQLDGRVELILDGGPALGGVPSTILDCTVTPPRLLRHGAIPAAELRAVVGEIQISKE